MTKVQDKTQKIKISGISRRNFLKGASLGVVGSACSLGAISPLLLKREAHLLRPPGALEEDQFLASCIKCGQCLQVCPPQVISLAGLAEGFGVGTPYIIPSKGACILCEGLPCVLACPTGSLDHGISEGKEANMGLAVLTHPETCLGEAGVNDLVYLFENSKKLTQKGASPKKLYQKPIKLLIPQLTHQEIDEWKQYFKTDQVTVQSVLDQITSRSSDWLNNFVKNKSELSKPCTVCLTTCPIAEEQPISFKKRKNIGHTPVVEKSCVGCGVCEMTCPTDQPSIEIVARLKWKGEE